MVSLGLHDGVHSVLCLNDVADCGVAQPAEQVVPVEVEPTFRRLQAGYYPGTVVSASLRGFSVARRGPVIRSLNLDEHYKLRGSFVSPVASQSGVECDNSKLAYQTVVHDGRANSTLQLPLIDDRSRYPRTDRPGQRVGEGARIRIRRTPRIEDTRCSRDSDE